MGSPHVAVVTGASSGIGAAIAARLAAEEALVFVCGRNAERTSAVAASLGEFGGRARPIRLDVANPASIRAAVDTIRDAAADVGPVDWLVNNAGMARSAPLLQRDGDPTDPYTEHLAVNFHGARLMIEALLPAMLERRYGRVVNVASSAGLHGYPYVSAYCASKHALVGYSRAAALELARTGVGVNLVCPHYVDSPMTDRSVQNVMEKTGRTEAEARAFFASQNPGGRLVAPETVAAAVRELLVGERTGMIVELDGSEA